MKDVRLIKHIPDNRLQLISGELSKQSVLGDLGETGPRYSGPGGRMVVVHIQSVDGGTIWKAAAYWNELESTVATTVDWESLFDAAALQRSGECPWTSFAYPTSIAEPNGLPPDCQVQSVFAELQRRGIRMAIWRNGTGTGTTYLACRYDDRLRVDQVIADLERQGILEKHFFDSHCAMLFERRNRCT